MDAIKLLTDQHQDVDRAFKEFESLGSGDTERKKEIARSVITDLSTHADAGIEEVAFYPTVKEALPDMAGEIDHDLEEHNEVKQLLSDLQGMDPADDEFDKKFTSLVEDVRHHVDDEEHNLFPRVAEVMTAEELGDLGQAMEDLQSKVPTNPHPHAPQEPPANVALGPVAGVLDRLRDSIRERAGKSDV